MQITCQPTVYLMETDCSLLGHVTYNKGCTVMHCHYSALQRKYAFQALRHKITHQLHEKPLTASHVIYTEQSESLTSDGQWSRGYDLIEVSHDGRALEVLSIKVWARFPRHHLQLHFAP